MNGRRGRSGRIGAHVAAFAAVGLLVLLVELLDGLDLFLELHPPILKPDFDLPLREAEGVRHLDPPPPRQVVIRVELLLQFESLVAGVRLPTSTPQSVRT